MNRIILSLLLNSFAISLLCGADLIAARQEFFRTVEKDPKAVLIGLKSNDPEIRRYALYRLIKENPIKHFDVIARFTEDQDEQVRFTAVSVLPSLIDKDPRVKPLLQKVASRDPSRQIRSIAVQSTWPFHREIKLLRNDPTWDYEVKTIKSIPLETVPWLFTTDPLQDGHLRGLFKVGFDRSGWKPIKMGVWENQGFADYDGVAWYLIKFKMPPKMDCNAVEISFGAVDESAWVWLNGVYLGSHDIGPEGWKEPFSVDCRKEIRWGEENILVIRVYDAAFAGGIYKPVRVDILK